MAWETVRNVGHIVEKTGLSQKYGMGKSKTFLKEVAVTFARSCANYYDVVGELPFIYRERQIQSILLPAIAKVADAVFVEQPITRKVKRELRRGRIDYWVLYQKYVFLIELKHSWFSVVSGKIRKETGQAWSTVLGQIESISPAEAEELSLYSNKSLKIGILLIPCFKSAKYKNRLTPIARSTTAGIFDTLIEGFTPVPNWCCMWSLHHRLQTVHAYEGGRNEIYPCVFLNALVKTL